MHILPPNEYNKVIGQLDLVPFDTYFARSVIENHLKGRIYVDSIDSPEAYYILHPYGLSLLLGTPNNDFKDWLKGHMLGERGTKSSHEWMQVNPDIWNDRLRSILGQALVSPGEPYDPTKVELHTRVNFEFNRDRFGDYLENNRRDLPDGYRIVDIDERLFGSIEGTVVPKSFWDTPEDFLKRGRGFCILNDEEIVSWSYTAWVHGKVFEIGIETAPAYRGRGFAEIASVRFIEHCLDKGLDPVWSCRLENTQSYKLALKLGFIEKRRQPFYRLCDGGMVQMYHIDDEQVTLKDLKERILDTDLVPSRATLTEDIDNSFIRLEENGYVTLSDLRKGLKNAKKIPSVSEKTGVEVGYLTLLRREIESYFPKPFPIESFPLLDERTIRTLQKGGIKNTRIVYEALQKGGLTGISTETAKTLAILSDLTRIQWTNPTVAMMLLEAGYESAKRVAEADPEQLCKDLERVNEDQRFFKGKIGLKDVKRLVNAASFLDL